MVVEGLPSVRITGRQDAPDKPRPRFPLILRLSRTARRRGKISIIQSS
jgi:hypothetical protein